MKYEVLINMTVEATTIDDAVTWAAHDLDQSAFVTINRVQIYPVVEKDGDKDA